MRSPRSCAAPTARACRSPTRTTASAREIRRQIDELVAAGATDEEVRAHFVDRYGEWILLAPSSPAVWVLPFVVPWRAVMGAAGVAARPPASRPRRPTAHARRTRSSAGGSTRRWRRSMPELAVLVSAWPSPRPSCWRRCAARRPPRARPTRARGGAGPPSRGARGAARRRGGRRGGLARRRGYASSVAEAEARAAADRARRWTPPAMPRRPPRTCRRRSAGGRVPRSLAAAGLIGIVAARRIAGRRPGYRERDGRQRGRSPPPRQPRRRARRRITELLAAVGRRPRGRGRTLGPRRRVPRRSSTADDLVARPPRSSC